MNNSEQEFELLGYIDGQPIFRTKEEAEEYGQNELGCSGSHEHKDENGNIVYMACDMHPEIDEDMGVELEPLLAEGWEIISVGPAQNIVAINDKFREQTSKISEEKFYQIVTNPNAESVLDVGGNKVRFIYAVGPGMGAQLIRTSRQFCKRMLGGRQFIFRYEDIMNLNVQLTAEDSDRKIIPRPNGTDPDIFQWKGSSEGEMGFKQFFPTGNEMSDPNHFGANCRHLWIQLIFSTGNPNTGYDKPITNNIQKERRASSLELPSDGQSGNVNPKARPVRGDRMEAFSKEEFAEYWDNQDLVPVGYIQGLPIYDNQIEAEDASNMLGCGGVIEPVEYLGKRRFQACSYGMKKAEVQEQIFKSIEEKKMIYTPLMIPNILIPRLDDVTGERYFVRFKPDVIEKIRNKFMTELRNRETNYEHTNQKFQDVVMVESWIVESDSDKAYSLGFTKDQIPFGTWMGGFKILDSTEGDKVWNEYIKTGKVKGASVEGDFILKFSREDHEEYLLEQIINILKNITE